MINGTRHNLPWLTIVLAGLAAALYAVLGPAPEAWIYDRAAIADGEWWRLFSGHWLHGDGGHFGWNMAALLLLGTTVEMYSRRLLIAALLFGSLGVDAMLWLATPGLTHYCGLSGVLNALLLPALATLWRADGNGPLWLIGGLSIGKILVEMMSGDALFTHTLWASVPESHLAGWLAGLMLLMLRWRPWVKNMRPSVTDSATFSVMVSTGKRAA